MNAPAENRRFEDNIAFREDNKETEAVMDRVLRSGTEEPYYFFNEGRLREQVSLFREHFMPDSPEERQILYAMKANPRRRIMEVIKEEGIDGFDCASAGEIGHALSISGVGSDQIFFNNPVKRGGHVTSALGQGVSYFTVQSRDSVKAVLDQLPYYDNSDLELAVRIGTDNPDAEIKLPTKFGCSPEMAIRLLRRIRDAGVKTGLAMNVGSQNKNPQAIVRGLEVLANVAKKFGGDISSINLGGGFPINYYPEDRFDLREHLEVATEAVGQFRREIFGKLDGGNRVKVEPGRRIVGPTLDLAVPVIDIDRYSKTGQRRLTMADGVFTSFSDAVLHGWRYNLQVYTRDARKLNGTMERYVVYGQTCDSGDCLGEYTLPADIKKGDFLWARNAGAYMDSQASYFNGFLPPGYVVYNT